ncbi:expansin-A4-like [Gastrolobium bilobum]|uniref:expansin-A4-like n=1 Tax=Gastrolobium bilobum TaxID=150636 RepID=UPI002AAFC2CA|nr:expansin-A4-like [Gastrolobium bilobum]
MAFPLEILLFFLIALPISDVHADIIISPWRYEAYNNFEGGHRVGVTRKHHRPKFSPSQWKEAHATFYEGNSGTFGGACGYQDVVKEGYGLDTTALSTALFNNGRTCGACFQIKCVNSQWCKGQSSIYVTATDLCPPNYSIPSDNGGWCNPPRKHFDLAIPAYLKFAEYRGGIVPVIYRRVPCKKEGGIRFTMNGNPYFNLVKVWNVGGAGEIVRVQVMKDDGKFKWTDLRRNWGQNWDTDVRLVGERLSFRVTASDGRSSVSRRVAPKYWQFGQTYEGKNFP